MQIARIRSFNWILNKPYTRKQATRNIPFDKLVALKVGKSIVYQGKTVFLNRTKCAAVSRKPRWPYENLIECWIINEDSHAGWLKVDQ